jgi:hypothetical protein
MELNRRVEESRRARVAAEEARSAEERRVLEERQQSDREWMGGMVQNGPKGVKQELAKLRHATQDDAAARATAIAALHTLFFQLSVIPKRYIIIVCDVITPSSMQTLGAETVERISYSQRAFVSERPTTFRGL